MSPATGRKPSLLSLPGELRNRIYDALLAQDSRITLSERTQLPRHPASIMGLLATSRLVRAEFRSLFLRRQQIAVTLDEVASYVACFYPTSGGTADQHARLVLLGPRRARAPAAFTVELMPVLCLLCDSAATFSCRIDATTGPERRNMVLASQLRRIQHLLLCPDRRSVVDAWCGDDKPVVSIEVIILYGGVSRFHVRNLEVRCTLDSTHKGRTLPVIFNVLAKLGDPAVEQKWLDRPMLAFLADFATC